MKKHTIRKWLWSLVGWTILLGPLWLALAGILLPRWVWVVENMLTFCGWPTSREGVYATSIVALVFAMIGSLGVTTASMQFRSETYHWWWES